LRPHFDFVAEEKILDFKFSHTGIFRIFGKHQQRRNNSLHPSAEKNISPSEEEVIAFFNLKISVTVLKKGEVLPCNGPVHHPKQELCVVRVVFG
jgi:hypothetical protein